MGAGKTSVVRRLARLCGSTAIDTDRYIERRAGAGIATLFERDGEEGFRALEAAALRDIVDMGPVLVACGGGTVVSEESRRIISENGFTVHLRVNADEAKERISNYSRRPLFRSIEAARALCDERAPLYEELADLTIDTAGKGTTKLAYELISELLDRGVLCKREG
jgi:shikimate kinase